MVNGCNELITSNDYRDYIVGFTERYYRELQQIDNVCVDRMGESWMVVYGKGEENVNISDVGYATIPKLYALMDTTSMDQSGITAVLNQPVLNARGQGVIIGFIDTGIDYTLDIFKFARGITKIEAIWDQTLDYNSRTETNSEEWFSAYRYGVIYNDAQINEALRIQGEGGDPFSIVPSRDTNGHGTFLAGIAAGTADGSEFLGAAPDSTIAMVKMKEAKQYLRDFYIIREGAIAYQENDIMQGVRFLTELADRKKKSLVICIGVGSNSGPHVDGTPLGNMLADVAMNPQTVVVTPTGNEANERVHYQGEIKGSEQISTIEINVGANNRGFTMEIWGESPEIFSVGVVSPTGEEVPRIPAKTGRSTIFGFVFDQTKVYVDYKVIESISGRELITLRFLEPTEGIWRVKVYGITGLTGKFNSWLPVREFLYPDTYFLVSSPDTTLTEPSTEDYLISIGAYNHVNGSIYINSGRGFNADGRVKPDIVAPGVNVFGPKPGGGYTTKSGTSIAAAHVAGSAALLLSWRSNFNYYNMARSFNTADVKAILIRGAARESFRTYPNPEWGFGKLDLYTSFEQMRIM